MPNLIKNKKDKLLVAITSNGKRKVVRISNDNLPNDIIIGISIIISILGIIILGW